MKIIKSFFLVLFVNILLLHNVHGQVCKSEISDSLFIPAVWHVLEDYYFYYYEYPGSSKQLINFVEEMLYINEDESLYWLTPSIYNSYFVTKYFLKKGITHISKSDQYINIFFCNIHEKFPIENIGIQVCEIEYFIGDFPQEYQAILSRFSEMRFFDLKGKAVILSSKLEYNLKSIQSSLQREFLKLGTFAFRKYQYEDIEVPINVIMVYDTHHGLKYYCIKRQPDNKLLYYNALESSLKEFCEVNKLSKIYLLTPDYYSIE